MQTAYATFIRSWITARRAYPWSFFIGNLLSGVIVVVLAYFTYTVLAAGELSAQFRTYAGTSDYMSFVILGAGVYLLAVRVLLGVSRSLITEQREGTLESLLIAPAGRATYFAGITAQWIIVCAGEVLVMLLITWPLGLDLSHVNLWTLVLVLPVAVLGVLGMGIILGAIMLATGDTYISQNTLFVAMTLVCGFTFPRDYLPVALQWVGSTLPVTGALNLLRAAVLQGTPPDVLTVPLILYTLLGLVYIAVGLALLPWAERRALEGLG